MSDNFIHKIDFEDLEAFHNVLRMPRPNNSPVDIEHQLIMQEETHQGVGFIRNIFFGIGDWWRQVRHQPAGQTRASTRRVAMKSHSLVRH
jgi:hypothetical protein